MNKPINIRPTKKYIAYKSNKECYRILADDYIIHDDHHKLYQDSNLVGCFPLSDNWVIMIDESIDEQQNAIDIITSYLEWREPRIGLGLTEKELIKIWWSER